MSLNPSYPLLHDTARFFAATDKQTGRVGCILPKLRQSSKGDNGVVVRVDVNMINLENRIRIPALSPFYGLDGNC